jgi:hypothetical protein
LSRRRDNSTTPRPPGAPRPPGPESHMAAPKKEARLITPIPCAILPPIWGLSGAPLGPGPTRRGASRVLIGVNARTKKRALEDDMLTPKKRGSTRTLENGHATKKGSRYPHLYNFVKLPIPPDAQKSVLRGPGQSAYSGAKKRAAPACNIAGLKKGRGFLSFLRPSKRGGRISSNCLAGETI